VCEIMSSNVDDDYGSDDDDCDKTVIITPKVFL
jgi:hypothetical protein